MLTFLVIFVLEVKQNLFTFSMGVNPSFDIISIVISAGFISPYLWSLIAIIAMAAR